MHDYQEEDMHLMKTQTKTKRKRRGHGRAKTGVPILRNHDAIQMPTQQIEKQPFEPFDPSVAKQPKAKRRTKKKRVDPSQSGARKTQKRNKVRGKNTKKMVPGLVRASTLNPKMKQHPSPHHQHDNINYYDESNHRYYKRPSSHKRTKKRAVPNRYSFGTEETYQTQTNSHSNPTTQYSVDSDEDENDYYDQYEDENEDDFIDDFWNAIDVNKHNIHHRESFIVKKIETKT